MVEKILNKMSELKSTYSYFGIRADDRLFSVGEYLPNSFNQFDEVEPEEWEEINGTCATGFGYIWFDGEQDDVSEVEKALRINSQYIGDHQYLIAGNSREYGNDEAEIIIQDAVVVDVLK